MGNQPPNKCGRCHADIGLPQEAYGYSRDVAVCKVCHEMWLKAVKQMSDIFMSGKRFWVATDQETFNFQQADPKLMDEWREKNKAERAQHEVHQKDVPRDNKQEAGEV